MDASDGAPARQDETPQEADPDDDSPGSKPGSSFFSTLFKRALNGHSDGAEDEDVSLEDAFERSSPAERLMINNILRLSELRVNDVMTPRADIVAISDEATLDDATAAFEQGGFSRLPVFRETLDDPIGFIHLKDLAVRYGVGCTRNGSEFNPADHMHDALFVPPSMGIVSLLQRMQGERVHMALVIDEFGGVDGLVTIEDLVEQIVGEIEDEHDADTADLWREEAPGIYAINARADIEEFEEAVGLSLRPTDWEEDVDTLGGLVFMLSGRVPARGELIPHPHGHEFQVLDADPRRIKRLRLTLNGAAVRPSVRSEAAE
ncbi:MAG: hemolysin family protein [Pseudomonadota bacterium]